MTPESSLLESQTKTSRNPFTARQPRSATRVPLTGFCPPSGTNWWLWPPFSPADGIKNKIQQSIDRNYIGMKTGRTHGFGIYLAAREEQGAP
jgi:hypothetical protein